MNILKAEAVPDKIFVKNLVLPCSVGVSEEERRKKQNVVVDVEILCSLKHAGTSDNLRETISYSEVQDMVTEIVTKSEFKLLETLAENVAALILKNPNSCQVTISVKKEKYAMRPLMGIEIKRDRLG